MTLTVRSFAEADRPACVEILDQLPNWFGIDEARYQSLTEWGPNDAALVLVMTVGRNDR